MSLLNFSTKIILCESQWALNRDKCYTINVTHTYLWTQAMSFLLNVTYKTFEG